ncbi:prohibitin family protein [Gottfriedia luciferensis]|uniref:prohibitin family protein n=1 Tax=Gottfriedia luciferensis TaxID=178774 RepID=UPI000B44AE92|nr:prohibitin family protein [Gottfriedia luciferensis]
MEILPIDKKKSFISRKLIGGIIAGVALVIAVAIPAFFIEKITPGYVGVVYSPNGGIQKNTLSQGWNFVGLFDKVTEYPIRLRTVEYKDVALATSDGKRIEMDLSYTYKIDPSKVVSMFNEFGPIAIEEIEDTYLKKRLQDAARIAVSKYTVLQLYGEKSSNASADIESIYKDDVKVLGFFVENLTLGTPKPDAKTQDAIDARVQAAQENDRKKIELETAKIEAERKKVDAQADADSQLIRAQGQAKANQVIQHSLTKELIEYKKAEKWDGKLPTVSGSDANIIQFPIDPSAKESKK